MSPEIKTAVGPAQQREVIVSLPAGAAERFQPALEWATARLGRARHDAHAVQQLRWSDRGRASSLVVSVSRHRTPKIKPAPELVIEPGEIPLDARGRRRTAQLSEVAVPRHDATCCRTTRDVRWTLVSAEDPCAPAAGTV
jgi:hypothetical protein